MILEYIGNSRRMLPHHKHVLLIEVYKANGHSAAFVQDSDGRRFVGPASLFRQKPAGHCQCDVCRTERTGLNPQPAAVDVDAA